MAAHDGDDDRDRRRGDHAGVEDRAERGDDSLRGDRPARDAEVTDRRQDTAGVSGGHRAPGAADGARRDPSEPSGDPLDDSTIEERVARGQNRSEADLDSRSDSRESREPGQPISEREAGRPAQESSHSGAGTGAAAGAAGGAVAGGAAAGGAAGDDDARAAEFGEQPDRRAADTQGYDAERTRGPVGQEPVAQQPAGRDQFGQDPAGRESTGHDTAPQGAVAPQGESDVPHGRRAAGSEATADQVDSGHGRPLGGSPQGAPSEQGAHQASQQPSYQSPYGEGQYGAEPLEFQQGGYDQEAQFGQSREAHPSRGQLGQDQQFGQQDQQFGENRDPQRDQRYAEQYGQQDQPYRQRSEDQQGQQIPGEQQAAPEQPLTDENGELPPKAPEFRAPEDGTEPRR